MIIEIDDWLCQRRSIWTQDPELAGKWLAEQARDLMSADSRLGPCQIRIRPHTHAERAAIGEHELPLTQDALLELASHILAASQAIADREERELRAREKAR